jgi:hypothetical protein
VTSPEDRLRQILLAEAEDLIPAGDGMQRIQQRLADRRSFRSKLVPAMAIAGVIAVAGAAAITLSLGQEDSLKQREIPGNGSTPEPSTPSPTPTPTPTQTTTGVSTSGSGIPVWPFTTDLQAADWAADKSSRPWASDPVAVTQHLMDDYLKLPGRAMQRTDNDPDVAVVPVTAGGRTVSQVRLERVGGDAPGDPGPWSVTGATSTSISVTQPHDGDDVRSPIDVAGTASDPDTSVHLRLMADRLLGEGYAMAGREIPWTHSLPWTGSDWSVAALVTNTFNGKGDLSAVTITAVRRGSATTSGQPAAGSSFLAIDQGHVVVVDARSGTQLRQLSYPQGGAIDSAPDRGGEDAVVWVRTQPDGCTSSIVRASLGREPAGVTVDPKKAARVLPALSADGRTLAWVERPCGGGQRSLIVRNGDGKVTTTALSTEPILDLDVRNDGWAVVSVPGRSLMVPPGSTLVDNATPLEAAPNCTVTAPAWDGTVVVAWQGCEGSWRQGRWDTDGAGTRDAETPQVSDPLHTAVDDGQLLVSVRDGRILRITDAVVFDVPDAQRWTQPDW